METGEEISAACDKPLGKSGWQLNVNKGILAGASAGRARTVGKDSSCLFSMDCHP